MFSRRIKELRLEKGLTLKQVSEAIGVTLRAVYNYEAGIREPSFDTLCKLCRFFEVSSDYLLGLSDEC